jgi:ATP-dependent protease Clp ATPase subunit
MLEPMFEIPSLTGIRECIITADCVLKGEPPQLVYEDGQKARTA